MGAFSFSLDVNFIKFFTNILSLQSFIETGTFKGDTVKLAIPYFKKIYSIELCQELARKAQQRFLYEEKVEIIQGNSGECLKSAIEKAESPHFIWLDAHWCHTAENYCEDINTPLIDELNAIHTLDENSVLLIDDARYITAPPLLPNTPLQWVNFNEVISHLFQLSDRHNLRIINDVIVYYPRKIEVDFGVFAQKFNQDIALYRGGYDINQLLTEISSKEAMIKELKNICEKRDHIINELKQVCNLREVSLLEKEHVILELKSELMKVK